MDGWITHDIHNNREWTMNRRLLFANRRKRVISTPSWFVEAFCGALMGIVLAVMFFLGV